MKSLSATWESWIPYRHSTYLLCLCLQNIITESSDLNLLISLHLIQLCSLRDPVILKLFLKVYSCFMQQVYMCGSGEMTFIVGLELPWASCFVSEDSAATLPNSSSSAIFPIFHCGINSGLVCLCLRFMPSSPFFQKQSGYWFRGAFQGLVCGLDELAAVRRGLRETSVCSFP